MEEIFACPVCGQPLQRGERAYRCVKNHSYDIASQGYVNLLLPNRRSSKNPGDNAEMVRARTRFLDGGSYEPLSEAVNRIAVGLCGTAPRVLDAGCGEGYYTARLSRALTEAGKSPQIFGIDLSKPAVRHAAVRLREARFAVASLFELPFPSDSVDLCVSIFAPLCAEEFRRVLRTDGKLLAVFPAQRHLFELKEILYDQPYENEPPAVPEGFSEVCSERLRYSFSLSGRESIQDLFWMTPYFYTTSESGKKRLDPTGSLTLCADFQISVFSKIL